MLFTQKRRAIARRFCVNSTTGSSGCAPTRPDPACTNARGERRHAIGVRADSLLAGGVALRGGHVVGHGGRGGRGGLLEVDGLGLREELRRRLALLARERA